MKRVEVKISGIVQGVGFRPFIFGAAKKFSLKGNISNDLNGVVINFEGEEKGILDILDYIKNSLPRGAKIEKMEVCEKELANYSEFKIEETVRGQKSRISISPDLGICEDCQREMDDPNSRFYDYTFTSCAVCGPRLTILEDIPYDRPFTSMRDFEMCDKCKVEYKNPEDRRYHAQTISCPDCGPKLSAEDGDNPLEYAISLIKSGKIAAIKGVGGYHLACDAKNDAAVKLLRDRKKRPHKPFAVMMRDIETVEKYCRITDFEKTMLTSPQNPIVLLKQKQSDTAKSVNPHIDTLGVMLPYTGFHKQLMRHFDVLVMTSGNVSSEPIVTDEQKVKNVLGPIADGFVNHNRRITYGCDDSVVKCVDDNFIVIRRSRGFAPAGITLGKNSPDILACGSDLKNTFCIYTNGTAYVSQHIGDLEGKNTFDWYEKNIEGYTKLLKTDFKYAVCDYHPKYNSTNFAKTLGLPVIEVQHHHAHITAVMGEHGIAEPVIGVAFDGTGYGDDGGLWGGEFFVADRTKYNRIYHLENIQMPGGEAAIKEPWRLGASVLEAEFGELPDIEFSTRINRTNWDMLKKFKDISPPTSSAGRLFDAVSSILGVRQEISYEGQAAIELEAISDRTVEESYDFEIENGVIKTGFIIRQIVSDISSGKKREVIAAKFHNTMAETILETCKKIRAVYNISKVALGGGVFQNTLLLERTCMKLTKCGFEVYYNKIIPLNDGGISFGQMVAALEKYEQI